MEFSGRSVVLTGVGREGQVGEAVARAFAERGARVYPRRSHGRPRRARASDALNRRRTALGRALRRSQLTPRPSTRSPPACARRRGGRVHAAGASRRRLRREWSRGRQRSRRVDRQLTINVTTAYLTARAFLPLLRTTKGAIVFFGRRPRSRGARRGSRRIRGGQGGRAHARSGHRAGGARQRRAPTRSPRRRFARANVAAMGPDAAIVTREAVADVVLWLCSDASARSPGSSSSRALTRPPGAFTALPPSRTRRSLPA